MVGKGLRHCFSNHETRTLPLSSLLGLHVDGHDRHGVVVLTVGVAVGGGQPLPQTSLGQLRRVQGLSAIVVGRRELEGEAEEVGHGHMTVHVIKSYVWESHMKPFAHRVAA